MLPGVAKSSASEQLQRWFDNDNSLLKIAFAYELIDLIEPATMRAAKIAELAVAEPSSEQADQYLEEACRCYYYGLFTACAVMCRSLLEEALEDKLPRRFLDPLRNKNGRGELTLGTLLHHLNNDKERLVSNNFLRFAGVVNRHGTAAAHLRSVKNDQAWDCLQNARRAVTELLNPAKQD